MTVKIKEYVVLASSPADDYYSIYVRRNMINGVASRLLNRAFKDKRHAMAYRDGVRDGINLARGTYK